MKKRTFLMMSFMVLATSFRVFAMEVDEEEAAEETHKADPPQDAISKLLAFVDSNPEIKKIFEQTAPKEKPGEKKAEKKGKKPTIPLAFQEAVTKFRKAVSEQNPKKAKEDGKALGREEAGQMFVDHLFTPSALTDEGLRGQLVQIKGSLLANVLSQLNGTGKVQEPLEAIGAYKKQQETQMRKRTFLSVGGGFCAGALLAGGAVLVIKSHKA